ncbi:MAG: alcohol dehydrogenase catalytic domain-containing protein [Chloroflexales bacterium]|nr:alcohol dehydrogenase catalytic domain-containing protein [Chloroflexales bacterium]
MVQVHAASLNQADLYLLRGEPWVARLSSGLRRPKRPTLGADIAGRVVAVGGGVTQFQPGGRGVWRPVIDYTQFVLFPWLPYVLGSAPAPTAPGMVGLAGWLLVMATVAELATVRQQRMLRTREEEARRRAGEERLRIARDLHDVLGHHISLISVQAGVALHLMDQQPTQARVALAVIRDASKDALRELRSVLDVLRQVQEAPPRTPAPGLAQLGDLAARASEAGLQVQTEVSGELKGLSASVDLTAFRIIQEALTNVMRHSGQTASCVQVTCTAHELTLRIDNPVARDASRPGSGPGQGIRGMQERATALGGVLEAGPRPDGGFRVFARLPLNGSPVTTPGAGP